MFPPPRSTPPRHPPRIRWIAYLRHTTPPSVHPLSAGVGGKYIRSRSHFLAPAIRCGPAALIVPHCGRPTRPWRWGTPAVVRLLSWHPSVLLPEAGGPSARLLHVPRQHGGHTCHDVRWRPRHGRTARKAPPDTPSIHRPALALATRRVQQGEGTAHLRPSLPTVPPDPGPSAYC